MIHVESNNKNKVAKNKVANKNKKCHLVKRIFKLKIILHKHHFTKQIFISFIYN